MDVLIGSLCAALLFAGALALVAEFDRWERR